MQIFLTTQRFPKEAFMGTLAWYFFVINVTKVPLIAAQNGMMTRDSLLTDLYMIPAILIGVFWGKWLFPRISQKHFTDSMLVLAGIGALHLIFGSYLEAWIKILLHR